MTYSFNTQLKQGHELELDQYFSPFYHITPATPEQQRQGIDRIFKSQDEPPFGVEYKADAKSERTGNIFIETISVERYGAIEALGWAYTSQAKWILIYQPKVKRIFKIDSLQLKRCMNSWELQYPTRPIPNRDYFTCGLLVPIDHLIRSDACIGVIEQGKKA